MRPRWEVVARIHLAALADGTPATSWITPVSEGLRPHRTHLGAALEARRFNRSLKDYDHGYALTWEARRWRVSVNTLRAAFLDVLAPVSGPTTERVPIFEWPHETTPTLTEVTELAEQLIAALAKCGHYTDERTHRG